MLCIILSEQKVSNYFLETLFLHQTHRHTSPMYHSTYPRSRHLCQAFDMVPASPMHPPSRKTTAVSSQVICHSSKPWTRGFLATVRKNPLKNVVRYLKCLFFEKHLQHLKVQLWISRTWFRCEASPVSPLSPINRATFRAKLQGDRCFPCFSRVFRFSLCFFQHFLPHVFPATAFFTVWKPFGRTRLFGFAKKNGYLYLSKTMPSWLQNLLPNSSKYMYNLYVHIFWEKSLSVRHLWPDLAKSDPAAYGKLLKSEVLEIWEVWEAIVILELLQRV